MDAPEKKEAIRTTFNTVATGYGNESMQFFHTAAAQLPGIFQFTGNEHILDVATGTGIAACELANALPQGRVTGIDFSNKMLEQANISVQQKKITNVNMHYMDMQAIDFAAASFDGANCSFGIFFVDDMHFTLKHIVSKVKPGGKVVTCAFGGDSFSPNVDLFVKRIKEYGVEPPDEFGWRRVGAEDKYRALYEAVELQNIQIHSKDLSYYLPDVEGWWDIIWYAGFRGLVEQIESTQVETFKRDHLAEVSKLLTPQGLAMQIEVLFAEGTVA